MQLSLKYKMKLHDYDILTKIKGKYCNRENNQHH